MGIIYTITLFCFAFCAILEIVPTKEKNSVAMGLIVDLEPHNPHKPIFERSGVNIIRLFWGLAFAFITTHQVIMRFGNYIIQ